MIRRLVLRTRLGARVELLREFHVAMVRRSPGDGVGENAYRLRESTRQRRAPVGSQR